MTEDGIYRQFILELYRQPLNKKQLADFDVAHRATNPTCGDDVTIQIKFDAEDRILDIGYQGDGCALSVAATSLVTEAIKGKKKVDIEHFREEDMEKLLGRPVVYTRKNCILLGLRAIKACIS